MQHVVPDASALGGVGAAFPCPVPGCTRGFTRSQNLDLHLRTHGADAVAAAPARPPLDATEVGVKRLYFCPVAECPCVARSSTRAVAHACSLRFSPDMPLCCAHRYALGNAKGQRFAALNKLKRHYQSKHGLDRSHVCAFCAKPHSTKDKQRTHEKWCHVRAWCVCGASTSSIEAMTANSKARKGHLHQSLEGEHKLDLDKMAAERSARVQGGYVYEGRRRRAGAEGGGADDGGSDEGAAGDGAAGSAAGAAAAGAQALLAAHAEGAAVEEGGAGQHAAAQHIVTGIPLPDAAAGSL